MKPYDESSPNGAAVTFTQHVENSEVFKLRKLLLLGGRAIGVEEILDAAKEMGLYAIVADYLPPEQSEGKRLADEQWMISTADLDLLEQKCRETGGVDAVFAPVSEFNLEQAMKLCQRLGLPFYCSPEAWHYSRDKADFKRICRKNGAPVAEDYDISDALTDEELDAVHYPVVVKPVDLCSNRGVSYCYNREELISAYRYAQSISHSRKIIVEKFLTGRLYIVVYAMAGGVIHPYLMQEMTSVPGKPKSIYSVTTTATFDVERFQKDVAPAVIRTLEEIGCREGVAFTEMMLDEEGHFNILEMGYRLDGGRDELIYYTMKGYNMYKWMLELQLGMKHDICELPPMQEHMAEKCGCSYILFSQTTGIIREITGFESLVSVPGIISCKLFHNPGETAAEDYALAIIMFCTDDIDSYCDVMRKINETVKVLDEDGNDMILRYEDYDYLKATYYEGKRQAMAKSKNTA